MPDNGNGKKKTRKATANEKALLKAAKRDVKGKSISKHSQRQLGERGVSEYKSNRSGKEQGRPSEAKAAANRESKFLETLHETKRGQKVVKKALKSKTSSPTSTYIKGTARRNWKQK